MNSKRYKLSSKICLNLLYSIFQRRFRLRPLRYMPTICCLEWQFVVPLITNIKMVTTSRILTNCFTKYQRSNIITLSH